MKAMEWVRGSFLAAICVAAVAAGYTTDDARLGAVDQAEVQGAAGIPKNANWRYWDRGGDLGTAWRDVTYDDSSWGYATGPLGYGETYLWTTIGYGGNASAKYITSYF